PALHKHGSEVRAGVLSEETRNRREVDLRLSERTGVELPTRKYLVDRVRVDGCFGRRIAVRVEVDPVAPARNRRAASFAVAVRVAIAWGEPPQEPEIGCPAPTEVVRDEHISLGAVDRETARLREVARARVLVELEVDVRAAVR